MAETFGTLGEFKTWFLSSDGPGVLAALPRFRPVTRNEESVMVTLYRDERFQAQLLVMPPHHVFEGRLSPHFEADVLFMGGDVTLDQSGYRIDLTQNEKTSEEDRRNAPYSHRGAEIHYSATETFNAMFGEDGGVFLVLQQWKQGHPPGDIFATDDRPRQETGASADATSAPAPTSDPEEAAASGPNAA